VRALDVLAWFERDDAGVRLWAARRIEAAGDLARALPQYRRSLALEPDLPVLTDLVRIYFARGDADGLEPLCRELYERLPQSAHVAAATPAGSCYSTAGRWRQARADELSARDAYGAGSDASLALGY
jgi:tetratricopeptide (TPR) repeat protein